MHLAAVVIGAVGATIGLGKSAMALYVWGFVGVMGGDLLTNSYLHLIFLTEGINVVSCFLATAGILFVIRHKTRAGASLLLAGAAGVVASVLAYALLLPVFVPGPPVYPEVPYYFLVLAPVPLLLAATTLVLMRRVRVATG